MTNELNQISTDPQQQRKVLGEKFLIAFYKLTSTAKLYEGNNQVLRDCVHEFREILSQWIEMEAYLAIYAARGQFFIQDEKLIYRRENINIMEEMGTYFEKRMIPGFRFTAGLIDAPIEQVLDFVRLLNNSVKQQDPLSWLNNRMKKEEFPWAEIVYVQGDPEQDDGDELKDVAQKTYSYALASIKEVSGKITSQGRAGVSRLKRIVQNMVDLLSKDDAILLGMSTVRDHDDYTYTHSVNVALLSLCLGKRIGLSRISLSWLGISGLVHDLGKVEIPQEILNKPGKLTPREFQEMEKHPLKSVSQVLQLQASRDLKTKILLPPLEHHMKYDFSGYPRVRRKQPISLFGRIIAIADVFDALSSPRIYRPVAYSPDKVLGIMIKGAGKDFDPLLLKVFINMLGAYPAGTLLKLDTGEKGLVVAAANDGNKTRPRVVLLASDSQGRYKKGKVVNLAERNPHTGSFVRNIVNSYHPSSLGLQPAEFIM